MSAIDKCWRLLRPLILAVMFLPGLHGFSQSVSLSHRDSLILEMVEFIQPDYKLTRTSRKHIEGRIKSFPHKIIRRDTVSHFLNTAYAVAYYEFARHDYKKAKKWSDEFSNSSLPPGFISNFFHYTSVTLGASMSLNAKGKFKSKKVKNSWYTPINLGASDSLKFDSKRTYDHFLDSFFDDVPLDCSLITYRALLSAYHQGGGRLEFLNGYTRKGFIDRCFDSGRHDVLDIVYDLWNVGPGDFVKGTSGVLQYRNPSLTVDSVAVKRVSDEILLFNPEINRRRIDSLISIGSTADLSPRVINLINLYFLRSRFQDLVDACQRYDSVVTGTRNNTLHNYWALGLSNLGRYEEALTHYDKAIANSTDPKVISTMVLNKACTLGEMGRSEESVSLFMQEKERQTSAFEKFVWYDNLGYVYSFFDAPVALSYYTEAERYLDSGVLFTDRKIRHFCRKSRVLEDNPFLRRQAIEKAMDYTLKDGSSDADKGMAYAELAEFTSSIFDYKEADRLFREALHCYANLDNADLRKIHLYIQYSSNLSRQGRGQEALRILLEQSDIIRQTYGRQCKEYAAVVAGMIQLSCAYPELEIAAQELYDELPSLNIPQFDLVMTRTAYEVSLGNWQLAMTALTRMLDSSMNPMQKLRLMKSYEELAREYFSPEEYQVAISKMIPQVKSAVVSGLMLLASSESRALHEPLSALIDGAIAKGDYSDALSLSLFRKGLLSAKKQTVERRFATKGSLKNKAEQLRQMRRELYNAIAFNDSTHIPELSVSVIKQEREIAYLLANDKNLMAELDRTLSQVTECLAEHDLAIEFIRYCGVNYAAFVINRDGLISFAELGTEEELLSTPAKVWNCLNELLSGYECLYFCPDGKLNNIGLEFADFNGPVPVNQVKEVHRVFHLAEINKHSFGLGDKIVAIGVSDHNSPPGNASTLTRGNWTDLPNVDYELQLISRSLQPYDFTLMFNDRATEPAVASLSGSPVTTLHLSTHGFYRSNDSLTRATQSPQADDYHIARRFLSAGLAEVSGLVLRGGNISWRSPYILEEHDDILTADEIELMQFPELNLTVLSACESGLGQIDSEGVWGLQRAFRIAGTKSLICALSKVDDYWTAQFMDAFYEMAADGNSIYDSFQAAQKWLCRELPDNPEIWSSFILIE
ncbi:MAG: CHAT domain-containing protein [Bacteroidales bacterium]|nr:CHAT domain-containing protein [Bacteroidales bacterium]